MTKPINFFIDANIFLDFYRFTKEKLDELEKLRSSIEKNDNIIWVTEQVKDEYKRSRDDVIQSTLNDVGKNKINFPPIFHEYDEYEDFKKLASDYDSKHTALVNQFSDDAEKRQLKADIIIGRFFESAKLIETSEELIKKARLRYDKGNPPGKRGDKDNLGDAINWEAMLINVSDGQELSFVTGDPDFFSKKGSPNSFLINEWKKTKKSEITFFKQLSELIKKEDIPDYPRLADAEREAAVNALAESGSFASTHKIIDKLNSLGKFTNEQAIKLFNASINNGQVNGVLDDDDVKKLFDNLEKNHAASLSPGMQHNLGWMYRNGLGVLQNDEAAVKWYRLAAKQGFAVAQYDLGWMYYNGLGVLKNDEAAVKWYRLAAEQGHAMAQYGLGWMYLNGLGVLQDDEAVFKWITLAAEQGLAMAQHGLGNCYYNGNGVVQDVKAAFKWYRLAAEQGDAMAQYDLGRMYFKGEGAAQDYVTALMWANIAASNGNENAVEGCKTISNKMTPEQITEAKERARVCIESGFIKTAANTVP